MSFSRQLMRPRTGSMISSMSPSLFGRITAYARTGIAGWAWRSLSAAPMNVAPDVTTSSTSSIFCAPPIPWAIARDSKCRVQVLTTPSEVAAFGTACNRRRTGRHRASQPFFHHGLCEVARNPERVRIARQGGTRNRNKEDVRAEEVGERDGIQPVNESLGGVHREWSPVRLPWHDPVSLEVRPEEPRPLGHLRFAANRVSEEGAELEARGQCRQGGAELGSGVRAAGLQVQRGP